MFDHVRGQSALVDLSLWSGAGVRELAVASPSVDAGIRTGRSAYVVPAVSAVVAGGLAVATVLAAPADVRVPAAVGAAVAAVVLCAAVATAAYYRELAAAYRAAAERAQETIAAATAEAAARVAAAEGTAETHAREAQRSEARRAAALAAFAGAAGRMQAISTSMLAELREMEHRHGDPRVLADLLHLDHRTAQAGRLADSVAVLSGARTGRRWAKPIAMESILRGAMGRIAGYQRVRLRAVAGAGIAGHAAEGVMHALAELLDNACNFSPPTTEVHVYATEVPAGVVVTIEDSGLVMSESALRRAERAVSGTDAEGRGGVDLSSLNGTRLGLAVVGHLARKHGLTVSYRPSAIGGTAVVVIVPRDLITLVDRTTVTGTHAVVALGDETRRLPSRRDARTASAHAGHARSADTTVGGASSGRAPTDETSSGRALSDSESPRGGSSDESTRDSALPGNRLPRRRRGDTLATAHPEGLPNPNIPANPAGPSREAASPPAKPSALGAFQRALSGRDSVTETPSVAVENDL